MVTKQTNEILQLPDHIEFSMGKTTLENSMHELLNLSYVVVLICERGQCVLDVNFRSHAMHEGDFLILYDDSITCLKSRSYNFLCSYYLMNRSLASDVAYALPNELFLFLSRFPFFKTDEDSTIFLSLWEKMTGHIESQPHQYKRVMIANQFQNLFLWLSEKSAKVDIKASNNYSRQEAICWKFWELIFEHCKQHREVAFYADLLNITPYYLSQLTKKFFNDAPKTLIDRQVVLEIKRQLTEPKRSMQQIADDLQFTDASYLGKYFKRQTGVGLTEYRKTIS